MAEPESDVQVLVVIVTQAGVGCLPVPTKCVRSITHSSGIVVEILLLQSSARTRLNKLFSNVGFWPIDHAVVFIAEHMLIHGATIW